MKKMTTISALALVAMAAVVAGCIKDSGEPRNYDITLDVAGLPKVPATRAPLDEWENTPVSVGYMFAATQTAFDKTITVTVEDPGAIGESGSENDGQHIKTGMEYPPDDSEVSFRGYYPVETPTAAGVVTYDISKGATDVMLSNIATGKYSEPIDDKLVFRHRLTRVTFLMRCAQNQSYPEPVFGIRAEAATSKVLMTAVTLDLGEEIAPVTFKVPGSVFCGDIEGFNIPLYGPDYVVVDMMLQPGTPLDFTVVSLTSDRLIGLDSDPSGIWAQLTNSGGEEGKRYTVELSFSGEVILAQKITVDDWLDGDQNLGGGGGPWW